MTGYVARATITIDASPDQVWRALVEPEQVKRWMLGTDVESDWRVGSPISWRGEMQGKPYEDKGEVLESDPPRRLAVTHYSPMMGKADRPENYHTVTYDLASEGGHTLVRLTQDGNESQQQADQFSQNWSAMLGSLKRTVEEAS